MEHPPSTAESKHPPINNEIKTTPPWTPKSSDLTFTLNSEGEIRGNRYYLERGVSLLIGVGRGFIGMNRQSSCGEFLPVQKTADKGQAFSRGAKHKRGSLELGLERIWRIRTRNGGESFANGR